MSTKKTQTFWAFTYEMCHCLFVSGNDTLKRHAELSRGRYMQLGYPVSPIVRIELPLPTKRKKNP